jgi:acyl-CoA reductase-like NAD-dependent aldehyde dehydrogenase
MEPVKLYINGQWVVSSATETSPVFNPSDETQIAATPMCGTDEVNQARAGGFQRFSCMGQHATC